MSLDNYCIKEVSDVIHKIDFLSLKNKIEGFWGKINDFNISLKIDATFSNVLGAYTHKERIIYINETKIATDILRDILLKYFSDCKIAKFDKKIVELILENYIYAIYAHELYHAYKHKILDDNRYLAYIEAYKNIPYKDNPFEIEADEKMISYLKSESILKGKVGELARILRSYSLNGYETKYENCVTKEEKIEKVLGEIVHEYMKNIWFEKDLGAF